MLVCFWSYKKYTDMLWEKMCINHNLYVFSVRRKRRLNERRKDSVQEKTWTGTDYANVLVLKNRRHGYQSTVKVILFSHPVSGRKIEVGPHNCVQSVKNLIVLKGHTFTDAPSTISLPTPFSYSGSWPGTCTATPDSIKVQSQATGVVHAHSHTK